MTIATFRMSGDDLRAFAARPAEPSAIRRLTASQYSRNVLLLRHLLAHLPDVPADARTVLVTAQEADPGAFLDLLTDPRIAAWLNRTVSRHPKEHKQATTGIAHVASVAAVAAARCRVEADLGVAAADGWVHLPTLRAVRVHGEAAVAEVRDGAVAIRGGDHQREIRVLVAGAGHRPILSLDDVNPYRDVFGTRPADRLSPGTFDAWRATVQQAWDLLTECCPARIAELTAGLRVLVPLVDPGRGKAVSITARQAYGAFGVTQITSTVDCAMILVHEFQHSKLNAVLDLVALHDGTDDTGYFAPWREDPRPLGGLLHGAFAFLGMAQCWQRLLSFRGMAGLAEQQIADLRVQVAAAVDQAERSPALTDAGRQFTTGLRQGVDEVFGVALPHPMEAAARQSLAQLRRDWELRNE